MRPVAYMRSSATGSAAFRSGVKLPSMSMPPIFEFRSTNCCGVICPASNPSSPYWMPTLSVAERPFPFGASGVTVTPKTARMKSKIPHRSPSGFASDQISAAGRPQKRPRPGTSSVRSAPNRFTFCPQRLSGFAGLLPQTGSRDGRRREERVAGPVIGPPWSGAPGQK